MAEFDLTEGVRKAFLAGVGAVALGAEKSQAIVEDLISKGELTVEQGKALNAELSHKVREVAEDAPDAVLKTKLKSMTSDERAAWLARAQQIVSDLDAETVEVEVEGARPSEG